MSRKGPQARKFTDEEIANLQAAYHAIDTDGSGNLDFGEVQNFLAQTGLDPGLAPILFFLFDDDKSGQLSFKEFKELALILTESASNPRVLFRKIFDKVDHNDKIDKQGIFQFCSVLGFPVTDQDVDQIMVSFDTDRSGTLSFEELCQGLGI